MKFFKRVLLSEATYSLIIFMGVVFSAISIYMLIDQGQFLQNIRTIPPGNVNWIAIFLNNLVVASIIIVSGVLHQKFPYVTIAIVAIRFVVPLLISIATYSWVSIVTQLMPFCWLEILAYCLAASIGTKLKKIKDIQKLILVVCACLTLLLLICGALVETMVINHEN
ncbi:stage II sporulation protein M [Lactobacillus sp. DCY120]|uniref:Stage II sporulation protein M n=1 Tax=Bombilactobacillus apium TaxID=2675299 RepID=A0A850RBA3_9LACO|nr:stage II sporulation protein M [Bombilactobacillus apium]NVY96596.1 stage II sporulation protein M [Bombilactobacillus apium]